MEAQTTSHPRSDREALYLYLNMIVQVNRTPIFIMKVHRFCTTRFYKMLVTTDYFKFKPFVEIGKI